MLLLVDQYYTNEKRADNSALFSVVVNLNLIRNSSKTSFVVEVNFLRIKEKNQELTFKPVLSTHF